MLYPVFLNVKAVLLNAISNVEHIEWFNDQYNGTIHTTPIIFVEFPEELRFQTLAGANQQAELVVRIHVVSKAVANQAGGILPAVLVAHEEINHAVFEALHRLDYIPNGTIVHNALTRVALQHHQYLQGWLVTTQDFLAMIYQRESNMNTATPEIEFNFL